MIGSESTCINILSRSDKPFYGDNSPSIKKIVHFKSISRLQTGRQRSISGSNALRTLFDISSTLCCCILGLQIEWNIRE